MPFVGFPILMYFPSGLCIYWATVSMIHLGSTLLLRTKFTKQMFGVDGYLPGTILYKQNHHVEQVKVKAVFKDQNSGIANSLSQNNLSKEVQKANELIDSKTSKTSNTTSKVEVFLTRPKKAKKNKK